MICDISNKTLIGRKYLRIRFVTIDGFIRIYDGARHLTLIGSEKYNAIYDRISYLINHKSGIECTFSNYYSKTRVDSYDSWPIEKILSLHIVIILVKSILNKDRAHYYYKVFLE